MLKHCVQPSVLRNSKSVFISFQADGERTNVYFNYVFMMDKKFFAILRTAQVRKASPQSPPNDVTASLKVK